MTKIEETVKRATTISNQILMNGIVAKALKNGFRWQGIFPRIPIDAKVEILNGDEVIELTHEKILGSGWKMDYSTLFFSHTFAKAFFGKKWKRCLKEMVLEEHSHDNRLDYFYKFLERDLKLIGALRKRDYNYKGGSTKEANCLGELMEEIEEDFKVSWHVKWREHNPISWFLCWLFEQNCYYMPMFFFYVHDWFCPEEQEVKEMAAAAEEDYKAGRYEKVRDFVAEK